MFTHILDVNSGFIYLKEHLILGRTEIKRKRIVICDKTYQIKISEKSLLPRDLILYNKITRKVEYLLKRKYDSFEIKIGKGLKPQFYFKNKDLKDYHIVVKNKSRMKINKVYNTKIISISNFTITLEIKDLIGSSSDYDINFKRLIAKSGLNTIFNNKVLDEANQLLYSNKQIKRTNLTNLLTITLDNPGAKDFDDAISCFKDLNGNYNLYIHIADVAHYVKEGSFIDNEARIRAFSIYPINGVVPMLPSDISNNLCSLKKGTIKDCISVIYKIDKTGKVLDFKIKESEIKVKENFYYDMVDENTKFSNNEIDELFKNLNELYHILGKDQLFLNSLRFYDTEPRFYFDENEKLILDIKTKEGYASKLIERLMIFTNHHVAKFLEKKNVKIPYRTHIPPSIDDIMELKEKLAYLDFPFNDNEKTKKFLNNSLKELTNYMPLEKYLISDIILRTQSKAIYEISPNEHFALGIKPYLHFTAPIRRYADLIVHRQLKKVLNNKKTKNEEDLIPILNEINETEKKQMKLERNMFKLATIIYFKSFGKKVIPAIILDINRQGFFIKFKNSLEGFVPIRFLDDYYYYDERLNKFYSDYGVEFCVGDIIKAKYLRSDLEKLFCDFTVVL